MRLSPRDASAGGFSLMRSVSEYSDSVGDRGGSGGIVSVQIADK
jgi:hypothetical protein